MKILFALPAALATVLMSASFALSEDMGDAPASPVSPRTAHAKARVLTFGEGDAATRFHVVRDGAQGRMTFRLADPTIRIERPPVVYMTTESGPREFPLTAVAGEPGVWVWSHEAVRAPRFDGSMRVFVNGKAYNSPLASVWTVAPQPRYGGRIVQLTDCGASVEVVQDAATGSLTVYSSEDVKVTEAPVITVTETEGPTRVTLTKVDSKTGVWVARHEKFKTTATSARIRLLVNGHPCEASLNLGSQYGGEIVRVEGGPSWEVVNDADAGHYTFYAVDETYDGRPYTVENPTVVVEGRTYNLARVEGQPRAWRLVGLDNAGSDINNAQLNFTLFGKTLSTRLGLGGIGIGAR